MKTKIKNYLIKKYQELDQWVHQNKIGIAFTIVVSLSASILIGMQGLNTEIVLLNTYSIDYSAPRPDNRPADEIIFDLLRFQYGFSEIKAAEALLIVRGESGFAKEAFNPSSDDIGYWQINWHYYIKTGRTTIECAIDIYCSTEFAVELHNEWDGWGPWVAAGALGLK